MDIQLSKKLKAVSFMLITQIILFHADNLGIFYPSGEYVQSKWGIVNSLLQYFISNGLTRTALPLFFVISGYLFFLNIQQFISFIDFFKYKFKKRIFTLFLPYVIWTILGILIHFIFLAGRSVLLSVEMVWPFHSFFDYIKGIFVNPIPIQLWYLRELMIYLLLTPFIYYMLKFLKIIPVITFFVIWFLGIDLIYFISERGLFFYFCGAYSALFINQELILKKIKKYHILILTTLWIFIVSFFAINKVFYQPKWNIYLTNIAILIGILPTWFIYDFLGENIKNKLHHISQYTFFIYAAHYPLIYYLYRIAKNFFQSDFASLVLFFVMPFVVISTLIFFGKILSQNLNILYKVITGGRSSLMRFN